MPKDVEIAKGLATLIGEKPSDREYACRFTYDLFANAERVR